jgi:hypothetical protein
MSPMGAVLGCMEGARRRVRKAPGGASACHVFHVEHDRGETHARHGRSQAGRHGWPELSAAGRPSGLGRGERRSGAAVCCRGDAVSCPHGLAHHHRCRTRPRLRGPAGDGCADGAREGPIERIRHPEARTATSPGHRHEVAGMTPRRAPAARERIAPGTLSPLSRPTRAGPSAATHHVGRTHDAAWAPLMPPHPTRQAARRERRRNPRPCSTWNT